MFGPWELTLGPRLRYGRWGAKQGRLPFLKGKLLMDLRSGAGESPAFSVDVLLDTVRSAVRWRDRPAPYPINGARLNELGTRDQA